MLTACFLVTQILQKNFTREDRYFFFLENSLLSAWGIKNYKVLLAVAEARKKLN